VSTLEWIAFVSNVVCVALVVIEQDINWPIGVIGAGTLLLFFWKSSFFAQAALQAFYIVESIYGWWMWTRRDAQSGRRLVQIQLTSPPLALKLGLAFAVGTAILYPILIHTSDPFPFWDAAIAAASIVAEYMLCLKLIESWPVYLATDIVSMVTLALTGYWIVFSTYTIFVALCVAGWLQWRRVRRRTEIPAFAAIPSGN
jgi:nicotinamide mononucleotide transporter